MTANGPIGRPAAPAKPRPEPADEPVETRIRTCAALSRGIVWADIVAEIERDAAVVRRTEAA